MVLVHLSAEHGEGLPLQQHGLLLSAGEQLQRAALHAWKEKHTLEHASNTRDEVLCSSTELKHVLTHEVLEHGLLVGQQVVNDGPPAGEEPNEVS